MKAEALVEKAMAEAQARLAGHGMGVELKDRELDLLRLGCWAGVSTIIDEVEAYKAKKAEEEKGETA